MVWREEIVLKYFDVSRGEAISSLRGVGAGKVGGVENLVKIQLGNLILISHNSRLLFLFIDVTHVLRNR